MCWSRLLIVLLLHSDDFGSHNPKEEISHGQVSVCVSNRHRGRPLPLQTQQRLRHIRWTRIWLWRDAAGRSLFQSMAFSPLYTVPFLVLWFKRIWCVCLIAAVSDSGWADRCISGPHEGTVPDGSQSHDAEHQHVVHTDPRNKWVVQKKTYSINGATGTLLVKALVIKDKRIITWIFINSSLTVKS